MKGEDDTVGAEALVERDLAARNALAGRICGIVSVCVCGMRDHEVGGEVRRRRFGA